MRIIRTRRGLRLVEDDVILSEVLARPGPTHCLFDVLAACVAALAPGPRLALLGFAGGGVVAPLRAMGFPHAIEAVDLDPTGEKLFRGLSDGWAGDVRVTHMDAVAWIGTHEGFDVIVEDLSVTGPAGTVKPAVSFDGLPALVRSRLSAGGVAVTNVLPQPGSAWDALLSTVARPHPRAAAIDLDEYENKIVIGGAALPEAAELSRRVRRALDSIGSVQARRLSVRSLG